MKKKLENYFLSQEIKESQHIIPEPKKLRITNEKWVEYKSTLVWDLSQRITRKLIGGMYQCENKKNFFKHLTTQEYYLAFISPHLEGLRRERVSKKMKFSTICVRYSINLRLMTSKFTLMKPLRLQIQIGNMI